MRFRALLLIPLISISPMVFPSTQSVSARPQYDKRAEKLPRDNSIPERIYDPENRDYHLWDQKEQAAYHRYWDEQHRAFRAFSKLNARQQCHYWTWRHKHPDVDAKAS